MELSFLCTAPPPAARSPLSLGALLPHGARWDNTRPVCMPMFGGLHDLAKDEEASGSARLSAPAPGWRNWQVLSAAQCRWRACGILQLGPRPSQHSTRHSMDRARASHQLHHVGTTCRMCCCFAKLLAPGMMELGANTGPPASDSSDKNDR